MYNDIKKIVKYQEMHTKAKSSKEKFKLEKKIIKLQSKYQMIVDDTEFGQRRNIMFYEDKKGRRVLVDNDHVLALNFVPIFIGEKFLSFMIAYFILLMVFLVVTFLNIFGLAFSDVIANSMSAVVTGLAIGLNVWTMFACKDVVFKYKWLLVMTVGIILLNSVLLVRDILVLVN